MSGGRGDTLDFGPIAEGGELTDDRVIYLSPVLDDLYDISGASERGQRPCRSGRSELARSFHPLSTDAGSHETSPALSASAPLGTTYV